MAFPDLRNITQTFFSAPEKNLGIVLECFWETALPPFFLAPIFLEDGVTYIKSYNGYNTVVNFSKLNILNLIKIKINRNKITIKTKIKIIAMFFYIQLYIKIQIFKILSYPIKK